MCVCVSTVAVYHSEQHVSQHVYKVLIRCVCVCVCVSTVAVYHSEQHVSLATSSGGTQRKSGAGEILSGDLLTKKHCTCAVTRVTSHSVMFYVILNVCMHGKAEILNSHSLTSVTEDLSTFSILL